MARLTAAERRNLPASDFAGPGRSFPIPDAGHARAALGRINNAPASARGKIRAKAEKMLHKKGSLAGGDMPRYEDGGQVDKTGPAVVHKGELVIPADHPHRDAIQALLEAADKGATPATAGQNDEYLSKLRRQSK